MTIGIYALYWEEQDLIYIGQSVNIEKRFKRHTSNSLAGRHSNYKVQNAYNLYGLPKLIILEGCSTSFLDEQEIYWTKEFNSINVGLNITEAGAAGFGPNSGGAKYSIIDILKVFRYSYLKCYKHLSVKQVAKSLNVHEALVNSIRAGNTHAWLSESFPYQYTLMLNSNRGAGNLNISGYTLVSPEGLILHIINLKKFARENGLDQGHLSKVVNGTRKQHKGWKLPQFLG